MLIVFLTTLIVSLLLARFLIWFFNKKGLVAVDYYKRDRRKIATCGGVVLLFTAILLMLIGARTDATITIILFGIFGLLDDFVDIGRIAKIIVPVSFALPIIVCYKPTLFEILVIALYVMVVANLVNMHSGFNGMAVGLSTILVFFLLLKTVIFGRGLETFLSGMLGAHLGLLYYNKYPSKIFDGNVGSMIMGATVGVGIVLCGFLVSGFIMLIPHTANFLMYVYWRIRRALNPKDERWKLVKFGKVREDGTLEVPNSLTLKWVLPKRYRMTERQVVLAMYALTTAFCLIALPISF